MTVYRAGEKLSSVVISGTVAEGNLCLLHMTGCSMEERFKPFLAFIRERADAEGGLGARGMMNVWPDVGRGVLDPWLQGKIKKDPDLSTLAALADNAKVSLRFLLGKLGYDVDGPEISEDDLAHYRKALRLTPYQVAVLTELSDEELDLTIEFAQMKAAAARSRSKKRTKRGGRSATDEAG